MTKRTLASGMRKIVGRYDRERAAQLMKGREKTLTELGCLTHHKVKTGQITDPELAAASQTVSGWDEALHQWLDARESSAAARSEGDSADGAAAREGGPPEPGRWRASAIPIVRHGLFGALLSVVALLLLCFAISTIANQQINDAITAGKQSAAAKVQEKLSDILPGALPAKLNALATEKARELIEGKLTALTRFQAETDLDIFNVPVTLLLVNNVRSDAQIQVGPGLGSGGMQLHLGIYAFLLIPLLAFFAGSFIAAWRMRLASARDAVLLSLCMGFAYALFLALLTQASGFSATVDLPRGMGSADVFFRFSWASAWCNGMALGTLFSLFGSLFRLGAFKFTAHLRGIGGIPYGEPIHQAMAVVVRGVGLCAVYALVLLWLKGALSVLLVLLLPQLSIYLWNIANGSIFHVTDFIANHSKPIQASVFTGIQGAGLEAYAAEWNAYIALSALIPIILLIAAGMRMRTAHGNAHALALVFSAVYGALMALLVSLTNIGVAMHGKISFIDFRPFTVEAGFSPMGTFATCFIAAYICVLLGMGLKKRFAKESGLKKGAGGSQTSSE